MGNYLQTGHESWNLMDEQDIGAFDGVVISPVNDSPSEVTARLIAIKKKQARIDVILDPQLYNPSTQKGQLPTWSYYSNDVDTADTSDQKWWVGKAAEIVNQALKIGATTICSPAPIFRTGSLEHYRFVADIADETRRIASENGLDTAITTIISMDMLRDPKSALQIASVLSGSSCDRIYLNFIADIPQREPLRDQASLATAVHLIKLLAQGQKVHVACAGHDVILWRAAGATDASSGKYMNVRRFSPNRWSDEQTAGRQLPYWNDDKLLTLIREQEVLRLDREGWFTDRSFADSPASAKILHTLREGKGTPWLKLSWVQYLRWFANTVLLTSPGSVEQLLSECRQAWGEVQRIQLLFQDPFNDGSHATAWLNALREGMKR